MEFQWNASYHAEAETASAGATLEMVFRSRSECGVYARQECVLFNLDSVSLDKTQPFFANTLELNLILGA
jgi:hypothetical protein